MTEFNFSNDAIDVKSILRNASPAELYEEAIRNEPAQRCPIRGL